MYFLLVARLGVDRRRERADKRSREKQEPKVERSGREKQGLEKRAAVGQRWLVPARQKSGKPFLGRDPKIPPKSHEKNMNKMFYENLSEQCLQL